MSNYRIKSVEDSPPPSGCSGEHWRRYEITNGINTIIGYRAGPEQDVDTFIRESVNRLNERYSIETYRRQESYDDAQ